MKEAHDALTMAHEELLEVRRKIKSTRRMYPDSVLDLPLEHILRRVNAAITDLLSVKKAIAASRTPVSRRGSKVFQGEGP